MRAKYYFYCPDHKSNVYDTFYLYVMWCVYGTFYTPVYLIHYGFLLHFILSVQQSIHIFSWLIHVYNLCSICDQMSTNSYLFRMSTFVFVSWFSTIWNKIHFVCGENRCQCRLFFTEWKCLVYLNEKPVEEQKKWFIGVLIVLLTTCMMRAAICNECGILK